MDKRLVKSPELQRQTNYRSRQCFHQQPSPAYSRPTATGISGTPCQSRQITTPYESRPQITARCGGQSGLVCGKDDGFSCGWIPVAKGPRIDHVHQIHNGISNTDLNEEFRRALSLRLQPESPDHLSQYHSPTARSRAVLANNDYQKQSSPSPPNNYLKTMRYKPISYTGGAIDQGASLQQTIVEPMTSSHVLTNRTRLTVTEKQGKVKATDENDDSPDWRGVKLYQAYRGQIKIAIYVNSGLITVHVKECRGLCWDNEEDDDSCNIFVKIAVVPDSQRRSKCCTDVITGTDCPVFNEKFSFELLPEDSRKRLFISVSNKVGDSRSELIGCMSFGIYRIIEKNMLIDGWYLLLSELLGRRKHLHAHGLFGNKRPPSNIDQRLPSSHSNSACNNSSTTNLNPNLVARTDDFNDSDTTNMLVSPMTPKRVEVSRAGISRPSDQLKRREILGINQEQCMGNIEYRRENFAEKYMERRCKLGNNIRGKSTGQMYSKDSLLSTPTIAESTTQTDVNDNSTDSAISVDSNKIVLRRGQQGFGFSVTSSAPSQILEVAKNSPADEAGLTSGDSLIKLNGYDISQCSAEAVIKMIRNCQVEIALEISRPNAFGSKFQPPSNTFDNGKRLSPCANVSLSPRVVKRAPAPSLLNANRTWTAANHQLSCAIHGPLDYVRRTILD